MSIVAKRGVQKKAFSSSSHISNEQFLASIRSILLCESRAIDILARQLPPSALELARQLDQTRGTLFFTGMGKSGHIARKLSATFSSLGMPACFIHPSEALHGDIGMIRPGDICVALSRSGSGIELASMLRALRRSCVQTALICCNEGALCRLVGLVALLPFGREAGDLGLVPTASSTMMLAFGDALAITIAQSRGFSAEQFGKLHPAGSLGRSLLNTVSDFMHPVDKLALLKKDAPFIDVLVSMTKKQLGCALVVAADGTLLGIVTDGDLRRACQKGKAVFDVKASDIMTLSPRRIECSQLAKDALRVMEENSITSLIVDDAGSLCGLVHIHDLIKAGITV